MTGSTFSCGFSMFLEVSPLSLKDIHTQGGPSRRSRGASRSPSALAMPALSRSHPGYSLQRTTYHSLDIRAHLPRPSRVLSFP